MCTCTGAHTYKYTRIHRCTHIHSDTHTCVNIHTHIHTWQLILCGNEFLVCGHTVNLVLTLPSSYKRETSINNLESRLKKCVVNFLDFWTFVSQRGEIFPFPHRLVFSGERSVFIQRQWLIFFRWEFIFSKKYSRGSWTTWLCFSAASSRKSKEQNKRSNKIEIDS